MLMHNSTSTEYETFNKKMANGIETDTVNLSIETDVKTNAVTMRNTHYSKSASVSPLGKKRRINIKDFDKICELGRGAFAKVDLRKCKLNNKLIAVKILNKHFMDKLNKSHEAYIEKEILSTLDHPNVIKLLNTFQDKNKLYFVLEYASNGDLSSFIRSQGALSYELARYYTAEIINGLEYLHIKKIAHRDLKPENMILNSDMHIKICDFGTAAISGMFFCKKDMKFKPTNGASQDEEDVFLNGMKKTVNIMDYGDYITYINSNSFVGTAEYASPELLRNTIINSVSVDIWALGCILYKFFHGKTPFYSSSEMTIFDNILNLKYEISDNLPEDVQDLIMRLLVDDPEKRLGCGAEGTEYDYQSLKSHQFFKNIDFENLHKIDPPHKIESISPITKNTTSPNSYFSAKVSSCDLSDLNFNISEYNISFIENSAEVKHKNNYSYPELNFFAPEFAFEIYVEHYNILENYLEIQVDHRFSNVSLVHEKIVKLKGWILYYLINLRFYSNGKLEFLDVYSNELLMCVYINRKSCIKVIDSNLFDIFSNKKNYRIKTNESDARLWCSKLINFINSL